MWELGSEKISDDFWETLGPSSWSLSPRDLWHPRKTSFSHFQDAAKGGCGLGGVCRHTKTAKTVKTAKNRQTLHRSRGACCQSCFPGPMSAVIAAGKKPPEPPKPSKPSNATHPLDHTPPLQHLDICADLTSVQGTLVGKAWLKVIVP